MSEVNSTNSYTKTFAVGVTSAAITQLLIVGVNRLGYANIGKWSYALSAGTGALVATSYHIASNPVVREEDQKAANVSDQILNPPIDDVPQIHEEEELTQEQLSAALVQEEDWDRAQTLIDQAEQKGWLDVALALECNVEWLPYLIERGVDPFTEVEGRSLLSAVENTDHFEPVLVAAMRHGDEAQARAWLAPRVEITQDFNDLSAEDRLYKIDEEHAPLLRCILLADRPALASVFTDTRPYEDLPIIMAGNPERGYLWDVAAVLLGAHEVISNHLDSLPVVVTVEENEIKQNLSCFYLLVETAVRNKQLDDKTRAMLQLLSDNDKITSDQFEKVKRVEKYRKRSRRPIRDFLSTLRVVD